MTASQSSASLHQIRTPIRYIVKGEVAKFYPAEREKSYWPADEQEVTITDLHTVPEPMSVAKNGFALLTHPTAVKDFFDPEEVQRVFVPEIIALAKQVNGASHAIAFGPVPRSDNPAIKQGRLPSFGAHVDYGRRTVEEVVREMLGDEAEALLKKRVVLIPVGITKAR